MLRNPGKFLAGFGALALAVSLAHAAPEPATADPGQDPDTSGITSEETTVEVTGRIITVQTESPNIVLGESPAARDEDHGEAEVFYTFETEDGMLISLDESIDDLFDAPPPPNAEFTGKFVVPDDVVEEIEQTDGLADEIVQGETLAEGTAEADAAVEALVEDPEPVTVAAGSVSEATAPAYSGTPTQHRLYVAVINNRGTQPSAATINERVESAASYWQGQANGALTMSRVQTTSYASSSATTSNRCGYGNFTAVANEAQAKFSGVSFLGVSANHLIIVAPEECAGGYIGLGEVYEGFSDGGRSLVTSIADQGVFKHTIAHELGHNLGFQHAHGIYCSGSSASTCHDAEYGDIYSVMGYSTVTEGIPTLNTVSREMQGIIDSGEVAELDSVNAVVLQPRAAESGVRAAKFEDADGSQYYVEYRSETGADADAYSGTYNGGFFGSRTVSFGPGVTVQQVHPDRCASYPCGFRTLLRGHWVSGATYRGALAVNETYTTPAGSKITVNSIANGEATVKAMPVGRFTSKPTPKVTGTVRVGKTLKAKAGTWSPKPSNLQYRWYRNGAAIGGATKSSYTLKPKDRGKKITVKVTASKTGYYTTGKTSKATKKVAYGKFKASKPKVTGTKKVGKTLTVKAPAWSPKPSYKYQWLRNGKKISGATKPKYKLTAKDQGKRISVRVTGTKSGYAKTVKTSAKTKKIAKK